jgi:hypothetical protein
MRSSIVTYSKKVVPDRSPECHLMHLFGGNKGKKQYDSNRRRIIENKDPDHRYSIFIHEEWKSTY